jgi:two-component system response regulator DevR
MSGKILLKPEAIRQARQRITSLANGEKREPGEDLTEREREVLGLVARGYTNKRIADTLFMSEKNARNHVSHILEKLGLERRSEAAAYAVEHQLIPPRNHEQN